jgi:hypothetical protein
MLPVVKGGSVVTNAPSCSRLPGGRSAPCPARSRQFRPQSSAIVTSGIRDVKGPAGFPPAARRGCSAPAVFLNEGAAVFDRRSYMFAVVRPHPISVSASSKLVSKMNRPEIRTAPPTVRNPGVHPGRSRRDSPVHSISNAEGTLKGRWLRIRSSDTLWLHKQQHDSADEKKRSDSR